MVLHLHETNLRLDSSIFRSEQNIDLNLVKWTNQTIVDEIKAFANAAGVPAEYMASVKIVKTGWMKCQVELEYVKNGKPLGIYFERGTPPHTILGNPLRFFWEKIGRWVSFNKVKHPGQKDLRIMERAEKNGLQRLADVISNETSKYLEEVKIP